MARRGGNGRRQAREEAFARQYESRLGLEARNRREGQPIAGRLSHNETKNERMIRELGAAPAPDPRVGGRRAHLGTHGAPDIYEEKAGGRAKMRGKRG